MILTNDPDRAKLGRPKFEPDVEALLDLIENGTPKQEIAETLGCSVTTLNKRIADIREKEGILLNWRAIRSLRLTEIQAQILEQVTPEKIANASLKDLVLAFKILQEKESEIENPEKGKIGGLVAYLIELERRKFVVEEGDGFDNVRDVSPTSNQALLSDEEVPQF